MKLELHGYTSEKVVGRTNANGDRCVVAGEPIGVGELVAVWGGSVVTREFIAKLVHAGRTVVQIDEELFLASEGSDASDWINHSCDPNLGLRGQIVLIAIRPIAAGEELCFDYAMTDGSAYDEFDCRCGARWCRGRVTADDWQLASLQQRYGDYFSPYLARRIAMRRSA